jgi:tetratricopeptide (TPR) repeat protein
MRLMSEEQPSRLAQVRAIAQIVYAELQYWCVGMLPESYHWKMGSAWDIFGNPRKAAHHLARFLQFADNAYVRGRLGHSYAQLGLWSEASREYERANQKHPHPEFALGHASAELRLGNRELAAQIVADVEAKYPKLEQKQMEDLAFIKEELRHRWNAQSLPDVG